MRVKYDEQLKELYDEMVAIGGQCENSIAMATKSLLDGNLELAAKVMSLDSRIEEKEREIVNLCMGLLLKQQPVATDLRMVSSALKMVTDMKRIGDLSADIAEIVSTANINAQDNTFNIHDMAVATIKMVTDSIDAFINKDADLAAAVIAYDDVVDAHFDNIKEKIIHIFSTPELQGEYAVDLLMIAKYFERIGDHAVNIANWVVYSITGHRD